VSCVPQPLTPSLPVTSSRTFQVRQIAQCGGLMYAVGSFTEIISPDVKGRGHFTARRNNVFSFHAARPFRVTAWNPDVDGQVNSIAVGGPHCSTAYLGGKFDRVHGRTVHNLAAVSTATGAVRTRFRGNANKPVETLLLHDRRLLTGGFFTQINGSRDKYYVALSSSTGIPDGYLRLNISGNYRFPGSASNRTRVYNQQLSPGGTRLLAEGDFTSVGGRRRQQVFMLSLGRTSATVTGWTSPDFSRPCGVNEPFYVRAAAWGPNGTAVYVADTGFAAAANLHGRRRGLCDAVARFPAAATSAFPTWVNYTGCDSLYSVAAGSGVVYIGGHERWADNNLGCNKPGRGAIPAQGMAGLNEHSGALLRNARRTRGLYIRSRGLGADDMLLTRSGLWIASDNLSGKLPGGKPFTSQMCGGIGGHAGICLLPG
jgi:hypothetical protein